MLLSQKLRVIFEYSMITIGSLISAIGLGLFLVEANVVPGGVTGISMAINFIWDGISVGTLILLLNIPLFIWGVKELGNAFGIRTLYGFVTNSLFIDLFRGELFKFITADWWTFHGWALQETETIQNMMKNDFFFFMLVGTFLVGIGLGLIFKFKGTTAGTEIVCAIFKKKFGIKPGVSMLAVDFVVITIATVILYLNPQSDKPVLILAMYALASLYGQSFFLDRVIYGFDYAKNMMIMSNKNEEISKYIMEKLDRGVTAFYARGLYTNKDREVLMTIVSPNDARDLMPQIKKLDPNAFVILSNVHEVIGEGFRSREEVELKFLKSIEIKEAIRASQTNLSARNDKESAAQLLREETSTDSSEPDSKAVDSEHDEKE